MAPTTTSLQLLQQLQASSGTATTVAANPALNALTNVQHQLLLQQQLGLSAVPSPAQPPAVPTAAKINLANLQGLVNLASLSNSAGEYGQCRNRLIFDYFCYKKLACSLRLAESFNLFSLRVS